MWSVWAALLQALKLQLKPRRITLRSVWLLLQVYSAAGRALLPSVMLKGTPNFLGALKDGWLLMAVTLTESLVSVWNMQHLEIIVTASISQFQETQGESDPLFSHHQVARRSVLCLEGFCIVHCSTHHICEEESMCFWTVMKGVACVASFVWRNCVIVKLYKTWRLQRRPFQKFCDKVSMTRVSLAFLKYAFEHTTERLNDEIDEMRQENYNYSTWLQIPFRCWT